MEELVGNGAEGNLFFWIGPACAILLVLFFKGRRARFAIPVLFMILLVMNPLAKTLFETTTETGYYWRLLWIVPIIPACAALPAMVAEKVHNQYLKGIIAIAAIALFILTGSYTYGERLGRFYPATNPEKILQETIDPVIELLKTDKNPRVVADFWVGVFSRQYAPQVTQLYGRDIENYVQASRPLARSIHNELSSEAPDYTKIADFMLDEDYDYLITDSRAEGKQEAIVSSGFSLVGLTERYGVYQVQGKPTKKRQRNELGQVVSVTNIDADGNPISGETGYSTISYEYDHNGYIIREFHTDPEGNGIADSSGIAGYEKSYDAKGHVLMERTLGADGNAISNTQKYAEMRRQYNGNYLIKESYYDTAGNPINCINGYATDDRTYDQHGNMTRQVFLDASNQPVVTYKGFAEVHRIYSDENLMIREEYYGANREPLSQTAGHVAIEQQYDESGRVILRKYLDSYGQPMIRTDGYTEVKWIKPDENAPTEIHFLDEQGKTVSDNHLNLAKDILTDPEGWSMWFTPQPYTNNWCYDIGTVNLGTKQVGDLYSCHIEIEFRNVTAAKGQEFRFWTQGAQDGRWFTGNIWDPNLINLNNPPADGVYTFTSTKTILEEMTNVSTFSIGFRCDNWAGGSFRVREIKIEKGDTPTPWTPGV